TGELITMTIVVRLFSFFFSSRRRHTRWPRDWSSDVCSSDLDGRSAATIAMAAATLHAMSGGRFELGLGASTPQLAEGLHDTPFEPPVPRMRRTVTQIRALLRGERIPLAVTTNARALKLNVPPAPGLPIHVAALGDAMTRLAGELAEAWAPFLYPWSQLATGVERLREGATRGGHPDRLPEIHPTVPAVVA